MLSAKEIDILKHSLGLSKSKKPYRNYFATDIENSEYQPIIDNLVFEKIMKLGHTSEHLNYYWVTDKGRRILADVTGFDTTEEMEP
jgi:hypothetical protein